MTAVEKESAIGPGALLRSARVDHGMNFEAASRKTNIRKRYLRSLEDEDLAGIPDPAYARAFLGLYCAALGLEAQELIPAWFEAAEGRAAQPLPAPSEVARPSSRRPRRSLAWVVVPLATLAVGVALAIILTGGQSAEPGPAPSQAPPGARSPASGTADDSFRAIEHQAGGDPRQGEAGGEAAERAPARFALGITASSPVRACLLGDGRALIPDQVLGRGFAKRFEAASFELIFPDGFDPDDLDLYAGGGALRLPDTQGPSALALSPPAETNEIAYPSQGCG